MNILNKIQLYITFIVIGTSLPSCHFLEVEQTGKSSIKAFYSDIYALKAAVDGTYRLTYTFYDKYMLLYPEVAGDLIRFQSNTTDWRRQFDFISDEGDETTAVGYIWRNGYEIISNANEIIQYAPSIAKSNPQLSETVDSYIAQAYFLRALIHLDLCLTYGQTYTYTNDASHLGIAIMTSVPDVKSKISRSSAQDTYKQITSDLNTALGLFPSDFNSDIDYASPTACKALLARVYLYMGKYSEASSYASSVIDDYGLSLASREKYEDMFGKHYSGNEGILRLNGLYAGTNLQTMFSYLDPKMYPSDKLLSIFSEDRNLWGGEDIRVNLLNYTASGKNYSGVCMKYFNTEDISDTEKHYDPFILRLSEMYLIRAESLCKLGNTEKAANDIASLEARARGIDMNEISISYETADELDAIIMRERIKELFMEGQRLFDLTRRHESLLRDNNSGSAVTAINYPDDRFVLPIPLVELDANKNMQSNPINSTKQ